MPTEILTLAGATQFAGTAGFGFFQFSTRFSRLPRTTRVVINSVSYSEVFDGVALTTNVQVRLVRPGSVPSAYAIVGRGLAGESLISPITQNAELRLCGLALFRDAGDVGPFWDLEVLTVNKTEDATVAVDYVVCPFPETNPRDSQQ